MRDPGEEFPEPPTISLTRNGIAEKQLWIATKKDRETNHDRTTEVLMGREKRERD